MSITAQLCLPFWLPSAAESDQEAYIPLTLPHTAVQDDKCNAPLSSRSAYIETLQDGRRGLTKDNLGGYLQQAAHGCCTALHRATYAGNLMYLLQNFLT